MKKLIFLFGIVCFTFTAFAQQTQTLTDTIIVSEDNGTFEMILVLQTVDSIPESTTLASLNDDIAEINYQIWKFNELLSDLITRKGTESNPDIIALINQDIYTTRAQRDGLVIIRDRWVGMRVKILAY